MSIHKAINKSRKLSKVQIRLTAQGIYRSLGVSGVWDFVNKYAADQIKIHFCEACDADVPVITGEYDCLICGSETKLLSENAPLLNTKKHKP
jgi:hypothetical protein